MTHAIFIAAVMGSLPRHTHPIATSSPDSCRNLLQLRRYISMSYHTLATSWTRANNTSLYHIALPSEEGYHNMAGLIEANSHGPHADSSHMSQPSTLDFDGATLPQHGGRLSQPSYTYGSRLPFATSCLACMPTRASGICCLWHVVTAKGQNGPCLAVGGFQFGRPKWPSARPRQ